MHCNKSFDTGSWHSNTFTDAMQIDCFLRKNAFYGKKIKCINCIGFTRLFAYNSHYFYAAYKKSLTNKQRSGDISKRELDENAETISVDLDVRLYEPTVIVFDDGTTLELYTDAEDLPHDDNRYPLCINANTIPANVLSGTNHSNFSSAKLFDFLVGSTLEGVSVNSYEVSFHGNKKKMCTYCFSIKGTDLFHLDITPQAIHTYSISVSHQNDTRADKYTPCKLTYAKAKECMKRARQVIIAEGNDYYMHILPAKLKSLKPDEYPSVDRLAPCYKHYISIDEDDCCILLKNLLDKYYDKALNDATILPKHYRSDILFEVYEANIYTKDSIRQMLCDLSEYTDSLTNGAPLHEHIAKYFSPAVTIDFYRRFIRRMTQMLHDSDGYDYIVFWGP